MWQNFKIKWKLMISFMSVVVIPMVVLLFFVFGIIYDEINQAHLKKNIIVATEIENLIENARETMLSYTNFLVRDVTLREAAYYSILSEDQEELAGVLSQIYQLIDVDILEVGDKNGRVLYRAHTPDLYGDSSNNQEIIQNALQGRIAVDIVLDKRGVAIKSAGPLVRSGGAVDGKDTQNRQVQGTVMLGIYLNNKFLNRIKSLINIDVSRELAVGYNNKIITATSNELMGYNIDESIASEVKNKKQTVYKDDIELDKKPYFGAYIPLRAANNDIVGIVLFVLSKENLQRAQQKTIGYLLFVMAVSVIIAVVIGYVIARGIVNPLDTVVENITAIANREADLTQKISVKSTDEIGKLALMFNRLMDSFSALIRQTRDTADKVLTSSEGLSAAAEQMNASTEEISSTIQQISRGVTTQAEKVEQTSRVMDNMRKSVGSVA
ncbi:MAG: cache domain-containing protein, partial [Candidatus Omnitrophota bacterium]